MIKAKYCFKPLKNHTLVISDSILFNINLWFYHKNILVIFLKMTLFTLLVLLLPENISDVYDII